MKKTVLIICLVPVLTACAATQWSHSSRGPSEFYQDRASCENEARSANPTVASYYDPRLTPIQQSQKDTYVAGQNLGAALSAKSYFENCLYGKGYFKS